MRLLVSLYSLLCSLGINLEKMGLFFRDILPYLRDLLRFRRQNAAISEEFPIRVLNLHLGENNTASGNVSGHYFHQDLLVARRIHERRPELHLDLGSRIDGFVAHVASFRPITIIDIRPLPCVIPNVSFLQADMMKPLEPSLRECCDSLSCLHAIEHFGLGRYGDPICHDGHLRGLANLHQMLKPDGRFYFSSPIGPQRVEFNAQRVFSLSYLLRLFEGKYRIDSFSLVDDKGCLHENIPLKPEAVADNFGCQLGCGIFELTKL